VEKHNENNYTYNTIWVQSADCAQVQNVKNVKKERDSDFRRDAQWLEKYW